MSVARRTLLWAAAIIAVAGALASLLIERPLSDQALLDLGVFVLPEARAIPAFELSDHRGVRFDNARLTGGWSLLFFGFTYCPDVCPTTLSELAAVERHLEASGDADGLRIVLVSVDPERDRPAELAAYVGAFSDTLTGVTGAPDAVAAFAKNLHVAFAKVGDGEDYQVEHTGNIVIIDPQGRYHGFIKMPHNMDTIATAYLSLRSRF